MAMNFWQAQKNARSKTIFYLTIFALLAIVAATCAEIAMRAFTQEDYGNPEIPYVALVFLFITFSVAGFNYMSYLQAGGSYVAESMGGYQVDRNTRDPRERQLMNIVEEVAISTSLPVPPVYIIDAREINAFAAGTSRENAAIAVTTGTLHLLNRDELQGVIAHEFGHIYNGDMKIGMRVAAMIMGFFIATYMGLRLLQTSSYVEDENGRRGSPLIVLALILLAAGALTWFFGSILQAMVSRQREFLADACSVQYTRNPLGLSGALKKIARSTISDMPRDGAPYAHLYFNEKRSFWSRLFATHPPIEDRIEAIEGNKYDLLNDLNENKNV